MSKNVQQLYVQHSDADEVTAAIREYVTTIGKRFRPHPKYQLDGIEQEVRILIKTKRRFVIYQEREWVVVWEAMDYGDFADPDIARHLGQKLETTAIWLDFDDNHNIWAFQEFHCDTLACEIFLPESYFLGHHDATDFDEYGSCHKVADKFNAKRDLPEFLTSISRVRERMKRSKKFKEVTFRLFIGK
jgi:hypothetical protein